MHDGACIRVVAETLERFGRLDVIVSNAGVAIPSPKDSFDAADQQAALAVNLLAPADFLAAALPHLTAGASIVNISSVNANLPPKGAAM